MRGVVAYGITVGNGETVNPDPGDPLPIHVVLSATGELKPSSGGNDHVHRGRPVRGNGKVSRQVL